jgi:hypothetical protein
MEDTFSTKEAHLQDREEEGVISLFLERWARKLGVSRQTLRKGLKVKRVDQNEVLEDDHARYRRLVQELRDCGLIDWSRS